MSSTPVVRPGERVPARLLPSSRPVLSPVTRGKFGRVAVVYALLWSGGLLVAATGNTVAGVAAMGLLLPGGGHLASGHIAHAAMALAAFGLAVLVWWMIGAVIAPIAVWLAFLLEAAMTHSHSHLSITWIAITAGLVPCIVVVAFAVHLLRHRHQVVVAARVNTELAHVTFVQTAVPSTPEPSVGEATADDLAHLRFALDLALQPLSEFAGFDRRDQFREAALRYQLCVLGYALSMYRYTAAPAFAGYLAEAQEQSILKMGDKRVWGYWALENAWGRMSLGRDPVDNHDNVMLTGWQGAAVGMYESFGDNRFSRPGGLTYTWSDSQQYRHDFHDLAESIHRNMRRSAYTLFSCEPRWIYPVCNTFGVNTLVAHDRLHGTHFHTDLSEAIARAYEQEFTRPDGKLIGVRNETLGLSWNIWASDGVSLPTTYWMNAFLPDQAHRAWWLTKRNSLEFDGERYRLPRTAANRCDVGNYSFGSDSFAHTFLSLTAREMGDDEIADNAFAYVDEKEHVERSAGVARYEGLSTQGNLYSLLSRFSRPAANRDLIGAGLPAHWLAGPRLAEAAYPDVLVARAVTDGRALDLVLYPGDGGVRTTVVVDQLRPHHRYAALGTLDATVEADRHGRARVDLDIEGRTVVRMEPTS